MKNMKLLILIPLLFLLNSSTAQMQPGQPSPDRYDPYSQATFSPSMAIIIVILIAALFFMGFFSIYIRHCATSDPTSTAIRPVNGSQRNRRRGIPPAVIQTFPTLIYSEVKVLKIGKGALECAVCICEFEDDETLRLIPKCDHVFHPECIDAWLASHTTCPVCRANLTDTENTNPVTTPPNLESGSDPEPEPESDIENQVQSNENNENGVETLTENRENRAGGSRKFQRFPRSHSTGHSLIQPGENTERFTLRLPVDVRKEIMSRDLNRTNSLVVFRTQSSSRRGYRTNGEGSSRGKNGGRWLDRLDRSFKSERWVFRGSFSIRGPSSSSLKSPKVAAATENESGAQPENPTVESKRPPV